MINPRSTEKTIQLGVDGMTCGGCAHHISEALLAIDGVRQVAVQVRDRSVTVRYDVARVSIETLLNALWEAGYASRASA